MMTKERWADLTEKGQWDIMVALRGPDSQYGETVKWFTTSVIRGQMRGIFRVGGLVNTDLQLVVLPYGAGPDGVINTKFDSAGKYGWNHRHFCEHVGTAAMWMKLPILSIEFEVWHKSMSKGSTLGAVELILSSAEKWKEDQANSSYRSYLYSPKEIAELQRHLSEGRLY